MRALLISDKDGTQPLARDLRERLVALLRSKGFDVESHELGAEDVVPCNGCLVCHIKATGVCPYVDALTAINARIASVDLVCLLGPIVFGQFGSSLKNAADKLQYARMRSRFVVAIGYGDDVRDEEVATFIDIVKKHAGAANVVHPKFRAKNEVYATRSLAENASVCEQLGRSL